MKRNRMMRIASFLLIAVLATTCAISGTFAKYTSDFTGSSTARVAKWSFTVNGDAPVSNAFTFSLFDSIKDSDGTSKESDVDLDGNGNEKVIAPGTTGSFQITLENLSEVNATYTLTLTQSAKLGSDDYDTPIPIEYSADGTDWTKGSLSIASTDIGMNGGNAPITIQWRWGINGNDTVDTAIGSDAAADADANLYVYANVAINVTQKD